MSLSSEGFDEEPEIGDEELDNIVDSYVEEQDLDGVTIEQHRRFGVYLGRKNNEVRIGLSEEAATTDEISSSEQNFVLAHELGHDRMESVNGNTEYSKEHGLMARLEEGSNSLPYITLSETVAELSALEISDSENAPDFLDRNPFRERHEGEFTDYGRLKKKQEAAEILKPQMQDLKSADTDSPNEILNAYDVSTLPDTFQNTGHFSHSLKADLEDFDSPVMDEVGPAKVHYNHGEDHQFLFWTDFLQQLQNVKTEGIDRTNFLTHYWADKATSSVSGPRNEPQFEVIDSYIPEDASQYEGQELDLHTGEDIRETFTDVYRVIDSNSDEIFSDLEQFTYDKATEEMEQFVDRYDFDEELDEDTYPGVVANMENGSYDVEGVDYPHHVGCTLSKVLYHNGVESSDVVNNLDEYREVAAQAIEIAAEKGVEMDKGEADPSHEEYIRELEEVVQTAV